MNLLVQTVRVSMSSINLDLIRGLAIGFEYIDDYEDDEGAAFIIVLHLFMFRLVFIWEKNG